ncbi:Calcium-binding EGF domain [Seminavis robusta]|uniref:Calcium-binding EGF domain n=1 Tax=Seminavis robusta TaxID=568900 RepID=A0A9N8ECI2_9STRA|nr:Calcium-binding EGF domain [Seminavis robusta]|eukprot:Sro800_g204310.1 Calcium-binding EGF domain (549) ;mRNA; f:23164-25193
MAAWSLPKTVTPSAKNRSSRESNPKQRCEPTATKLGSLDETALNSQSHLWFGQDPGINFGGNPRRHRDVAKMKGYLLCVLAEKACQSPKIQDEYIKGNMMKQRNTSLLALWWVFFSALCFPAHAQNLRIGTIPRSENSRKLEPGENLRNVKSKINSFLSSHPSTYKRPDSDRVRRTQEGIQYRYEVVTGAILTVPRAAVPNSEIRAFERLSQTFYTRVIASTYPQSFQSISLVPIARIPIDDPFIVAVAFDTTVNFRIQGSVPSVVDVFFTLELAATETYTFEFLFNFARMAGPSFEDAIDAAGFVITIGEGQPTRAPTPAPQPTDPPSTPGPTPTQPTTMVPSPPPSTPVPSTAAPVTPAPSTAAPVSGAPVTAAPSTAAPVTPAPSTAAPVSEHPSRLHPPRPHLSLLHHPRLHQFLEHPSRLHPPRKRRTSDCRTHHGSTSDCRTPTTEAPVTVAPTTEAPVTVAPTTEAPVTVAPTTEAPVTVAPTTEAPVTVAPTTEAPVTVAPTTEAPVTAAPSTASPSPPTGGGTIIENQRGNKRTHNHNH